MARRSRLRPQPRDRLRAPLMHELCNLRAGARSDVFGGRLDRGGSVTRRLQILPLRIGFAFQPGAAARVSLAREQRLREPLRTAERVGALQKFEDGLGF